MIWVSGLVYYYLGNLRKVIFLTYLAVSGKLFRSRYSILEITIILFSILIIIINSLRVGILNSLLYYRLFWGFTLFYFYFKKRKVNIGKIITIYSLFSIIEYIIKLLLPDLIISLPNYETDTFYEAYNNSYQIFAGVHSFGGNRTVSGVILLSLFIYSQKRIKGRYFALIGYILSFSTTAFILHLFHLFRKFLKLKYIPILSILAYGIYYILTNSNLDRFSLEYILYILGEYKMNQIEEGLQILGSNIESLLIGNLNVTSENADYSGFGLYFGDFMLLDFLVVNGLLGILMMIFFIISKSNKRNRDALIIIILGSLHYHVIFSLAGQIFLGYYLTRNETT